MEIPAQALQYGLAGFIMVSVFWLIVRGGLITRKQHEEVLAHQNQVCEQILIRYEEMKQDRDYWRESSAKEKSNTARLVSTQETLVRQNGGESHVVAPQK